MFNTRCCHPVVFVLVICLPLLIAEDKRMPPIISKFALREVVYKEQDRVQLACSATGIPDPTYEWYKDDDPDPLDIIGSITQPDPSDGMIVIDPAHGVLNDGVYQCRAKNKYGVAMSPTTTVTQANIIYQSDTTPVSKTISEGESLRLEPYSKIESFPHPIFKWKTVTDAITNDNPADLLTNKRIALDSETGILYFSNVKKDDNQGGRIYKMDVRNAIEDTTRGGSPYMIEVIEGSVTNQVPKRMTPDSDDFNIVGIKGKNVTLKCFFSGYPTPDISWFQPDNPPSPSRIDCTKESDTECLIRDLIYSDEGAYRCTGRNSQGQKQVAVNLAVESIPTFTKHPMSRNITEGQRATFLCVADAKPDAEIEWFSNGNKIDPNNPGSSRLIISEDRTNLTLIQICKDCPGSATATDLQVFQCKISNKHGDDYASAYLNVLERTVIYDTGLTTDVELDPDVEGPLVGNLTCKANTDDLTQDQLTIMWWFRGQRLYDGGPYRLQNSNESLIVNVTAAGTDMAEYLGEYKCLAHTVYSTDEVIYTLNVKGFVPTDSPVTAGIADLWWIFLIIFIVLLLLILCICGVLYMQRNKGEDYPVDEKERENGNDPIEELKEADFHDYQRPLEVTTLKGSRASLGSSRKLESDEDDMVDMYGLDNDAGRFSEDGSFMGNYNTNTYNRPTLTVPHHAVSNA